VENGVPRVIHTVFLWIIVSLLRNTLRKKVCVITSARRQGSGVGSCDGDKALPPVDSDIPCFVRMSPTIVIAQLIGRVSTSPFVLTLQADTYEEWPQGHGLYSLYVVVLLLAASSIE
jgi:hypothetical protein